MSAKFEHTSIQHLLDVLRDILIFFAFRQLRKGIYHIAPGGYGDDNARGLAVVVGNKLVLDGHVALARFAMQDSKARADVQACAGGGV